jgi:hypothetical protein
MLSYIALASFLKRPTPIATGTKITPQACQARHCGVATATLQLFITNQLGVAGILLYCNCRKHA